jgi:hypothetical protein
MRPEGKEDFVARVNVTVSSQFFGWITGIGGQMEILAPENVRAEYKNYLDNIMKNYQ